MGGYTLEVFNKAGESKNGIDSGSDIYSIKWPVSQALA
jgi:hypothetical protein